MKLKDLPKDYALVGTKIKIPKKVMMTQGLPKSTMYIYSGWNKGLWLKEKMEDGRIYPFTFESFKDIEDYEVKD